MQEIIRANARYWLKVLQVAPGDAPLSESELRGATKAIEATLRWPALWEITRSLAQALHPYMEQHGYWADWDDFLQVLALRAQQANDEFADAEIFLWRGVIQRQRGDFRAATLSYHKAWRFYRRIKNQSGLARLFSHLGDVYRLCGQFWRAEVLCSEAAHLFDGKEIKELAQAENRWGLVYFDQWRYSDALPHFVRSETLWRDVRDSHGLAKVLHNLGELHRRHKDFEKALAYLEQAVQNYQTAGDEIYAARTQLDIGNVYLNQGDWSRAEAAYSQAEITLRRAGDSLDLAGARLNLGMLYTRMKHWNEAEACFARALEQWRSRSDIWREANTLSEIAMMHLARGDRTTAKTHLDEAWMLVRGQSGAHFGPLRQELTERRKLLV